MTMSPLSEVAVTTEAAVAASVVSGPRTLA
jgi:hypothetical protein